MAVPQMAFIPFLCINFHVATRHSVVSIIRLEYSNIAPFPAYIMELIVPEHKLLFYF